jgi:hypothetical protein
MLLRDLIRKLQDLYFEGLRNNPNNDEPEIVVDVFRQTDNYGNFQYSGTSEEIDLHQSGKAGVFVISGFQVDDTQISGFSDLIEDDASTFGIDHDVKHQLSLLSNFTRIKENIQATWGSDRCRKYLHGLLVDDRPGRDKTKVKGFPAQTYAAISNLYAIHDERFPQYICAY